MQVTFDPAAIVMAMVTALIGVIQLLGVAWIRSVQTKLKEVEERDAALQREIGTLRETLAREYVPRAEQRDMREEMRSALENIDRKLTDITNKLDRKQDKP